MRQAITGLATLMGTLSLAVCSGSAHAYDPVKVTNGGTVEGKVVFQGNVPVTKIIPTKDSKVCGGPRERPEVDTGANHSVIGAVVYLKAVEKGKPWDRAEWYHSSKVPEIDNVHCRFEPAVQIIAPGKFEILNSDPVLHNTHGFYGRRTAFNVALPNKGDDVTKSLDRPGMVRVECDAHGWMLGHVYVADSPYYTLTGKDGSFRITDVPPGNHTLVATQYYAGDTETPVTVKSGETATVPITLKK